MKSWKDITVKQYIKISQLGEFNIDDLGTIMELITIIYDMTWEEVENLPISEGARLRGEIMNLFNTELDQNHYEKEFTIGDFKFEFADLQNNWSFAKNVDLNNLASDFKNFAVCLTILYYPKDLKYETNKAIELSKLIEEKSIGDLYGAWWFFFLFSTASAKLTGNYSVLDLMTEMTRIFQMGLKDPEKLLPVVKRVLWKKLAISGISTEQLTRFLETGSNSGNMS